MTNINNFTFEEKQAALKVAGELMQWKFYEMNDRDTVAAKSEEEAKSYYETFIEREEIEEYFQGECDGSKLVIGCYMNVLTDEELAAITLINPSGKKEDKYYATALEWLEVSLLLGRKKPFIIASTEY